MYEYALAVRFPCTPQGVLMFASNMRDAKELMKAQAAVGGLVRLLYRKPGERFWADC